MTNINSEDFRKNYPPNAVPDTKRLQQNILAETLGLEQEIERGTERRNTQIGVKPVTRFFDFLSQPLVASLAAGLAIFAIAITLWSPNLSTHQDLSSEGISSEGISSVNNTKVVFDNRLSLSELSAEEIEFQELIMLEDELMFAQL